MRVLVIGSGGREHALCWKIRQSKMVTELYCAPGNPGIESVANCVPLKVDDLDGLLAFAQEKAIELTVVGPELPLSKGIVDLFRNHRLTIFGPTREAAQLESSKNFAKEIMIAAGVPTARHHTVSSAQEALSYLREHGAPIVLKADGLAAGKGVFVCKTVAEAEGGIAALFGEFKASRVVIEHFLEGVEVSYIAATDGRTIVPFAAAHDYKRIFDNDQGPNTGGMGSVCPTPRFTEAQGDWVVEHVMRPVLREMERRGSPFSGFLYAGLMISPRGEIAVVEFNARFGDPECQSILRRLDADLVELLLALANGGKVPVLKWLPESCVCLVTASGGYPQSSSSGDTISGLDQSQMIAGSYVFHAGTARAANGAIVTAGGRVLNITALGSTLATARQNAYKACDIIQYRGKQVRRDIGS